MPNVTMKNFTISSEPGKILVYAFWNARKSESAGLLDVIETLLRKKNWDSKMTVVAVEIEFLGPLSAEIMEQGDLARRTDEQINKILAFNKWDHMLHFRADDSSFAVFERLDDFTTLKAPYLLVVNERGAIVQMGLPASM